MGRSWRGPLTPVGIVVLCLFSGSSLLAFQPQAKTVSDGVYTEQQAARGQVVYNVRCASCHANNLAGRSGPALAGDDFLAAWSALPLVDLTHKIRRTMPRNDSARLTAQESSDILAYMLSTGKFPAGRTELPTDETALKQLSFPPRAAAPGPAAPGNVAQVMRGILFPSSNIIFTTQSIDPGAKKAPVDTAGGFDWLTWGGNVYQGWDLVDYAAISLAESAQLMLTPGRKCENGKPVPLNEPDWMKFTNELAEAGKAAYKASQTRNQETISESTNQLNDSCMNCHRVYRGRTHCVKP